MKRLWFNIKVFISYLMMGLRGADKLISGSNKETDASDLAGIEQHKEEESVYADLLRGEVTQEVKELRHEMYYSERKSHEYEYGGNGRAVKKNKTFQYSGNIEMRDGLTVLLVQENHEDPSSLMECGIYCNGENVALSEKALGDLRLKDKREFTIGIERDFIPSFRIEQYANKIVVKKIDDKKRLLDIYVSSYQRQFDNNSKMFIKSVEKIYMGDKRSDIVDFNGLYFITHNAYGADDLKLFKFNQIKFDDIVLFDGNFVLRFIGEVVENGTDLISEFYDEATAKKCEEHEMRKGATFNISDYVEGEQEKEYDVEQAERLLNELKNGQ